MDISKNMKEWVLLVMILRFFSGKLSTTFFWAQKQECNSKQTEEQKDPQSTHAFCVSLINGQEVAKMWKESRAI